MVKSIIKPNDIQYKEMKNMDEEDIDYASTMYEYSLYGKDLTIALGKEKYTYSSYNVVYYPIYLIVNEEPKSKIGIFEVESNQVINIIDEDGDVDLQKGNIIIYASKEFISKLLSENPLEELEDIEHGKIDTTNKEDLNIDVVDLTEEEPSGVLDLHISKEKKRENSKIKDELFILHLEKPLAPMLLEESEEDANALKQDYKEGLRTEWIEKFMHNNEYKITNVAGDGNCFFSVLCLAFNEIGKETTPVKLRALLAKEATDEQYKQYRVLYTNFLAELQEIEAEMKAIKKMMPVLKKRGETTKDKDEHKKILAEAKQFTEKNQRLKLQLSDTKELLKEFE
jgi:hypothetical protein